MKKLINHHKFYYMNNMNKDTRILQSHEHASVFGTFNI